MTRWQLFMLVWRRKGRVWDPDWGQLDRTRWQVFYWFKTLFCIAVGRIRLPDYKYSSFPRFEYVGGVAYYDCHDDYFYGQHWTEVGIGQGVLKGWYYTIYENGEM